MGFLIIERLIADGKIIPFVADVKEINNLTQEILIQNLCHSCPFFGDDCDFVKDRKASPCGGFSLLGHLLETKAISIVAPWLTLDGVRIIYELNR